MALELDLCELHAPSGSQRTKGRSEGGVVCDGRWVCPGMSVARVGTTGCGTGFCFLLKACLPSPFLRSSPSTGSSHLNPTDHASPGWMPFCGFCLTWACGLFTMTTACPQPMLLAGCPPPSLPPPLPAPGVCLPMERGPGVPLPIRAGAAQAVCSLTPGQSLY